MSSLLDEIIAQVQGLSDEDLAALTEQVSQATGDKLFVPNVGPQTQAYFCEADELYYGGAAGSGKRLSNETEVPVPLSVDRSGFKKHGDLKAGDKVFSPSGKEIDVLFVTDEVSDTDAYEVVFDTGEVIVADAEHLWSTRSDTERARDYRSNPEWMENRRKNRPSRAVAVSKKPWVSKSISAINRSRVHSILKPQASIKSTFEILSTLYAGNGKRTNHSVDVSSPVVGHDGLLPIEPYLFGLWIGDGHSKNPMIGMLQSDWKTIEIHVPRPDSEKLDDKPPRKQPFLDKRFSFMLPKLRELGVLGSKRIPPIYLRSSISQRISLLQGICDTDGTCGKKKGCVEVGFSDRLLAQDLFDLVSSLGLKATVNVKNAKDQYGNGKLHYRMRFLAPFAAFRMPRKVSRQKTSGFRSTVGRRYIVDVRKTKSVPMRCIKVSEPDGLYLVTRSFITTHNTSLICGLALNEHEKSIIFRREYGQIKGIEDEMERMLKTRDGYNAQEKIWRIPGTRKVVEFGAVQHEESKAKFQGRAHDLCAFDELPNFLESQYRFLIGWNRSANPNQRCRVVAAGNPPMDSAGLWVIKYWAPWLDPTHPNPAKPGELRWFTTVDGEDREVDGRGPHQVGGKMITARSRTFIPGKLEDNPDLFNSGYAATLEAMDEPFRTMLREGRFDISIKDNFNQVIPTAWVREAQNRWAPQRPHGVPMCAIGVDPTGGGEDDCVLAPRYDGWFAPLIVVPGKQLPYGKDIAGLIMANRRNHCVVVLDMGGGYGGAPYEILKDNGCEVVKYEGYKSSLRRTVDGKMKFVNDRSEAYWRFREALDPSQVCGSPIALPVDQALIADLTAPTFKITPNGIQITPKEEIVKKLGRSPNRADAVVMSWWQGAKGLAAPSLNSMEQGTVPRNTNGMAVNMGRGNRSSTGVNFGRRG